MQWAGLPSPFAAPIAVSLVALRVELKPSQSGYGGTACAALIFDDVWDPSRPDPWPWYQTPSIFKPDLDLSGDGTPESISVAVVVEVEAAKLQGVWPPPEP